VLHKIVESIIGWAWEFLSLVRISRSFPCYTLPCGYGLGDIRRTSKLGSVPQELYLLPKLTEFLKNIILFDSTVLLGTLT
jgi:hypothetical protein